MRRRRKMLNDFVEVFGFRPGSLNPLLSGGGFVGGVETDLVALRIRALEGSREEVAAEIKAATDEKTKVMWLGVLEATNADIHRAKKLARGFEFLA